MRSSLVLLGAAIAQTVLGQDIKPDADGRYTISAPGIKAQVGVSCCDVSAHAN